MFIYSRDTSWKPRQGDAKRHKVTIFCLELIANGVNQALKEDLNPAPDFHALPIDPRLP
jgi:hypothetical protein